MTKSSKQPHLITATSSHSINERFEVHFKVISDALAHVDWENRTVYADFLAQTYHYVRHSTRLLALASSRFEFSENAAHYRFLKHVSEEESHEKLALKDLQALGRNLGDFREAVSTRAFYQTQYYSIEHLSPWSLLGYILALECSAASAGPAMFARVTAAHGKNCGLFLRVHAGEDVEHVKQAFKLLENLDARVINLVESSAELSCTLYANLLRDLGKNVVLQGQAVPLETRRSTHAISTSKQSASNQQKALSSRRPRRAA